MTDTQSDRLKMLRDRLAVYRRATIGYGVVVSMETYIDDLEFLDGIIEELEGELWALKH